MTNVKPDTVHGYAALQSGKILEPFSYPMRNLEPFEILVEVSHCGLCHTDLHMMENGWNRSTYPLLPGHEIVGHIVEKGAYAQQNLGDRVALGWIHSTCLHCPACKKGDTNICQNKKGIYTQGRFGGFATHVIGDSRFAFQLPKNLSSAEAAPLLCAGATVYAPLKENNIQKGAEVGVIGIGGLGHLALQFGTALGYQMVAISSSKKKRDDAKQLGATQFYTLDSLPKEPCLDFILCTADQSLNWNQLLSLLRPNGTLCFVSRPSQGISFNPNFLVSTQRRICGSNNASLAKTNEMLQFAHKFQIKPWIEEFPIEEINLGIEKLRRNEVRYRIVYRIKS